MAWRKVSLGVALIGCLNSATWAMEPEVLDEGTGFNRVGMSPSKREPVSEDAAKQAVCMYRAKLAYEVINFRAQGGKRASFQVRFSEGADPDLKAQTLAAVDFAFDSKGSAEEVATLVYQDCTGVRI